MTLPHFWDYAVIDPGNYFTKTKNKKQKKTKKQKKQKTKKTKTKKTKTKQNLNQKQNKKPYICIDFSVLLDDESVCGGADNSGITKFCVIDYMYFYLFIKQ
jgi:hypothetical protein